MTCAHQGGEGEGDDEGAGAGAGVVVVRRPGRGVCVPGPGRPVTGLRSGAAPPSRISGLCGTG